MLPITRILVPIDWSESSLLAFRVGAALAQEHRAGLVLLYVAPLAAVIYGPPSEVYLKHMHEELCRIRPTEPGIHVEYLIAEGDPGAVILRTAEKAKCDLIVMGTHGRTGFNRVLMGSVTETVVRKAPCPVLTVKNPLYAPIRRDADAFPAAGRRPVR